MSQQNINVSFPNDGFGDPLRSAFVKVNAMFTELYTQAVFKEAGKGLSSNDYTTAEQSKLAGIATGAEVNVQANLNQEDNSQDNFVQGKETFLSIQRKAPQIVIYAGVNTFTVPTGYKVDSVLLVRTLLWEIDEWTQTGDILTITKTINTGNRIQINFF